jgi:RHS repeat-associated protein
LYLPGEQLTQTSSGTTGVRYYTFDGNLVAESTGSILYWTETNLQGSITCVVNAFSESSPPVYRTFTPYGTVAGSTGTWPDNRTFLNDPYNSSTGLVDIGARKYNPVTDTFISVDPDLDTSSPQTMTGYTYAADDPVNNADPSGQMLCEDSVCGSAQYLEAHFSTVSQVSSGSTGSGNSGSAGSSNLDTQFAQLGSWSWLTPSMLKGLSQIPTNLPVLKNIPPNLNLGKLPNLPPCISIGGPVPGNNDCSEGSETPHFDYYSSGALVCIVVCIGFQETVDRYGRTYQTFQLGAGCCFIGAGGTGAQVLGYGDKRPSPNALKNFITGKSYEGGVTAGLGPVGASFSAVQGLPDTSGPQAWALQGGPSTGIGLGGWWDESWTYPSSDMGGPGSPPPTCDSPVESRFNPCTIGY